MDRKDAIEHGYTIHDKAASMKRRCNAHDYYKPGHYMLTLVIADRKPLLGTLMGNEDNARVVLSQLGKVIFEEEIPKITQHYPMVRVWNTCIMPDHVHIIVSVKDNLPAGKHLGIVLRGFKAGCTQAWWNINNITRVKTRGTMSQTAILTTLPTAIATQALATTQTTGMDSTMAIKNGGNIDKVPAVSTAVKRPSLFEPGYNDKILLRYGQLDNWKRYLDDNPRRLLIKRRHPDLFTILHNVEIAGKSCQMVGNRFLLDIPDKVAVIIHRRYTPQECEQLKSEWLAVGECGGVLVGTAVAPKEKEIMREAMNRGYRIILLKENGFPPLYKPQGESFDACKRGQLLLISPWQFDNEHKKITRGQCLLLNEMAEAIAARV